MLDRPHPMEISEELRTKAKQAVRLLHRGKLIVTIAGPAGTGKSRLIKELIGKISGAVCVAVPTGQAARMLQSRGVDATTIHRLIYHLETGDADEIESLRSQIERIRGSGKGEGECRQLEARLRELSKPRFVLNRDSELARASLCVVDEASMVDAATAKDLKSFGVPLLAVGDPYQLGPVDGKPGFTLNHPDIELTTVYRQSGQSAILQLAELVRSRRTRHYREHRGGGVHIRDHRSMNNDDVRKWLTRADQIISATNSTRRAVNRRMLNYLGMSVEQSRYPRGREGEKLICLRNNPILNIFNGMPLQIRDPRDTTDPLCFSAEILADDGESGADGQIRWVSRGRANIYKGHFNFAADNVRHDLAASQAKADLAGKLNIVECDWGYCITVHKAQGSEWNKVLFLSESWPDAGKDPEDWAKLHYTAITRAKEKLAIIEGWNRR